MSIFFILYLQGLFLLKYITSRDLFFFVQIMSF